MQKVQLQEVFGISNDVPKYTYVDRSGLDKKFDYLLKTQRHMVVHGASKQGKSCLRKKNINAENCVVVQCLPSMNSSDLLKTAFRNMGISLPKEKSSKNKYVSEIQGGISAEGSIIIAKGKGQLGSSISNESETISQEISPEGYEEDVKYLAENLERVNKKLILEDFHYLGEDVRKRVAFTIKALYELGVFVIIIGIWSEQNLLTYYNGDLTGRIEEINLVWLEPELREVLSKGEEALNIKFSDELKNEMIASSFQNVGLLQRIAERICEIKEIYETQDVTQTISEYDILDSARKQIVKDIGQRYNRIFEVFSRGFRADTELKVYYNIFRTIAGLDDNQLIAGVPTSTLLKELQIHSQKEIRQSDLTSALDKIERLQASRDITPLLVSYNRSLRYISLTDREFLFFRKYSNEKWEWQKDE